MTTQLIPVQLVATELLSRSRMQECDMNDLRSEPGIDEADAAHVQVPETLDAASAWTRAAYEERWSGGETILLVEDEAFVRDVTAEVLRGAGYKVMTARDAAEAGRTYDQSGGEVDLLLTDVVLPGETGCALAEKLRQERPALKILLVTGYPEQIGSRTWGRSDGEGNDGEQNLRPRDQGEREEFLAKPFSTGVLLRRVRQLLDSDQRRRKTTA